jgi:predicted methyltransferase MtxX (methanogen marker protein 4)
MSAEQHGPTWSAVDEETHDLLSVISGASEAVVTDEREQQWADFLRIIRANAAVDGTVRANDVRAALADAIKPAQRVGAYYFRAKAEGILTDTGLSQVTKGSKSRNGGKPSRTYRFEEPR